MMNSAVQDKIISDIAKRMAQDIDDEILMGALGWHRLELDEVTVSGTRYLTVHPTNSRNWNDMMTWMVDTFGPSDGKIKSDTRWYSTNARFWFRDEKDRTWFILRWSR
jgi:hypothetical protein